MMMMPNTSWFNQANKFGPPRSCSVGCCLRLRYGSAVDWLGSLRSPPQPTRQTGFRVWRRSRRRPQGIQGPQIQINPGLSTRFYVKYFVILEIGKDHEEGIDGDWDGDGTVIHDGISQEPGSTFFRKFQYFAHFLIAVGEVKKGGCTRFRMFQTAYCGWGQFEVF